MNLMQIFSLVMDVLPYLFNAINLIQKDTGKPLDQVIVDVIAHLSPGQPNSASLAPTAHPSDMPINTK